MLMIECVPMEACIVYGNERRRRTDIPIYVARNEMFYDLLYNDKLNIAKWSMT